MTSCCVSFQNTEVSEVPKQTRRPVMKSFNALSFIFTSGIRTFYLFHKSLLSKSSSYYLLTKDSPCFFFASQKKVLFVLEKKKKKKKATLQVQGLSLSTFNGTTCSQRLGVCQHTWHDIPKALIPYCEQAINNRPKLPFSLSSKTRSLKFTCVDTISVQLIQQQSRTALL